MLRSVRVLRLGEPAGLATLAALAALGVVRMLRSGSLVGSLRSSRSLR